MNDINVFDGMRVRTALFEFCVIVVIAVIVVIPVIIVIISLIFGARYPRDPLPTAGQAGTGRFEYAGEVTKPIGRR
jgi:hypothetical protein